MTKFVIQSGGLKKEPEAARRYFAELLSGLGSKPKLLWCFFATLPDDCNERFENYTELFRPFIPKGIETLNNNARVEDFETQVRNADAIYLHGGKVAPLKEILSKYNLAELFKDKSVGTNSASSMVLAKHTWSCDERKLEDGLGFFDIKFLAHFKSDYGSGDPRGPIDWDAAYQELEEYGDQNLPMYALEEGEFVVIEK